VDRGQHNGAMKSSQVRIYAILARDVPFGVVFRRGPSGQVLLLGWDTSKDTFESGQWLKARIYERRCDLSPKGDLLLYFAANYRKPHYSWTAISRPPFLTALALWPKGDGWGGGGHFLDQHRIALNHREGEMALAEDFSLPRWLKVKPLGKHSGWGEDDPVWMLRLTRDGWTLVSAPNKTMNDYGAKVWIEFSPAIRWEKRNPKWPRRYLLEMSITGLKEKDGPWYLTEHAIVRNDGKVDKIGRSDWADWSQSGDLLFAMDGCLYRLPCNSGILGSLEDATKIADLSKLKFGAIPTPERARRWPRR
jgi:hypothetical protein